MTSEKNNSNQNPNFKISYSPRKKSLPGDLANAAGESHVDDVFRGHMVRYHCLVGCPKKAAKTKKDLCMFVYF